MKETSEQFAQRLRRPLRHRVPVAVRPARARWRWPSGTIPANAIPSTIVLDRDGPGGRGVHRRGPQDDLRARARPAPRGGVSVGETFRSPRHRRPAARRRRRGGAGRADQLRLALRAAAGARLPLLRLRPGRHRRPDDRRRAGRRRAGRRPRCAPTSVSAAGPDGRSARCCSCSASPPSSSPSAPAFGGLGRLLLEHADVLNRVLRRGHDRGRAGLPRLAAAAAAHQAAVRPPRRRAGRGAAAGHRLRAGLDAVPGPDAVGGLLAGLHRGHRHAAARCSASPTASGSGVPFVLVALGARWAMGATAFLRRHARTVTRVGGAVLVVVGLLLVTGAWTEIMQWLRSLARGHRLRGARAVTRRSPRRGRPAPAPPRRPSAGRRVAGRLLRWWRRLTAMRTALVLLFLLALAAVPGSLLPQRSLSQNKVNAVLHRPPDAGAGAGPALPVRRLQLAVVRRDLPAAVHLADRLRAAAGARARPGAAGRAAAGPAQPAPAARLRRAAPRRWPAPQALDVVEEELRVRRFRVVRAGRRAGALRREGLPARRPATCCSTSPWWRCCSAWPAASCGATRAASWSPRARASATPSSSTTPTRPGRWSTSSDLTPLCVDLDNFQAKYEENLTAASFTADIRYGAPGEAGRPTTIGVNHPLRIDGDRVYVTGHGYSPTFSVTLPDGTTFTDVSVPFLPTDHGDDGQRGRAQAARPRRRRATTSSRSRASSRPTGLVQNKVLTSIDPRPLAPAGRDLRLPGLPRPGLRASRSRSTRWTRPRSTAAG